MPFSSIGKFMQSRMPARLGKQAMVALALEAGQNFLAKQNPALAERVRLVSEKNGVIHAVSLSAAAAVEAKALKNGLFSAMTEVSGLSFSDLKISIRGTLVNDEQF
jgi:hypothetical protein